MPLTAPQALIQVMTSHHDVCKTRQEEGKGSKKALWQSLRVVMIICISHKNLCSEKVA